MKKLMLVLNFILAASMLGTPPPSPRFHVVIRDGAWYAEPNMYVPPPPPSNPVGTNQVMVAAWNSAASSGGSNAIAVVVAAGGGSGSPSNADQVLTQAWNPSNNAIGVYIVGGSSGSGLVGNGAQYNPCIYTGAGTTQSCQGVTGYLFNPILGNTFPAPTGNGVGLTVTGSSDAGHPDIADFKLTGGGNALSVNYLGVVTIPNQVVVGSGSGLGCLDLFDTAGTKSSGFCAPAAIGTTYELTMPANDAAGALTSDGAGTLSFFASSGTGTTYATTTGSLVNADCVSVDANGNLVDSGSPCAGGGSISGLTTNTIPKATAATTIGDSHITDNGTTITAHSTADTGAVTLIADKGPINITPGETNAGQFQPAYINAVTYIGSNVIVGSATAYQAYTANNQWNSSVLTSPGTFKRQGPTNAACAWGSPITDASFRIDCVASGVSATQGFDNTTLKFHVDVATGDVAVGSASTSAFFNVGANGEFQVTSAGAVLAPTYSTSTNCAANGSNANPSVVACGAASAGAISCSPSASGGTCTVDTSIITANSEVLLTDVTSESSRLTVTCNATVLTGAYVSAKSASTSFTITLPVFSVTPMCFDFLIVN